ncbi:MAG: hypothetical protein M9963_04245 [Kiritimatiellae bacterium]|nr:hypothetical protein [Kiritimatiellia bacterium]
MKLALTVYAALVAGLLTGCGSVQQAYKPQQLGNLADSRTDSSIEVLLKPDKTRARIGDPVTFTIIIRNVGTESVLIPDDPDLIMTWVYPDGKRDNLLRAERQTAPSLVKLKPGEARIAHSVVTTYYFDHSGVHEFRAVLYGNNHMAMNTELPAWQGRAVSNGYGVQFDKN